MTKWKFDPVHSSAEFSVRHLGISWVRGRFTDVSGNAEFEPDNMEKSSWHAQIEAKSIWTGNDMRDNHLRSKDFFDAENNPKITFESTNIEKAENGKFKITGDLTMRGVTKQVTLDVEYLGVHEIPSADGKASTTKAGFSAKTTVNRHDFEINWDAPAGNGVTTVGGEVDITINIEATKE